MATDYLRLMGRMSRLISVPGSAWDRNDPRLRLVEAQRIFHWKPSTAVTRQSLGAVGSQAEPAEPGNQNVGRDTSNITTERDGYVPIAGVCASWDV